MRKAIRIAICLAALLSAGSAKAALVEVTLVGHVSGVDAALQSDFSVGMPVTMTYVFDPASGNPGDAGDQRNRVLGELHLSVGVPAYEAVLAGGSFEVIDNRDYGNPAFDVEDLLVVYATVTAPMVGGLAADHIVVRYGERGAPPIEMVSDKDNSFVDSLPDPARLVFFLLQFENYNNLNFALDSSSVVVSVCGNGAVEAGEQCDDGDLTDCDGCSGDCAIESGCGDGLLCGAEECDDGNLVDTDECRNACVAASCGDAVVQDSVEECDDGNAIEGDACVSNCAAAACGDAVVHAGVEECDDGNLSDADDCLTGCFASACGDGFVRIGTEGCDDGNLVSGDGCSTSCMAELCGDNQVDPGEQCDDGNLAGGDGCSPACTTEACGNGIVDAGEPCDDGNMTAADGCEPDCSLPPRSVSAVSVPGVPVTTDEAGEGATALQPFQTSVTTPEGGFVQIDETGTAPTDPFGYSSVGITIHITAPPATAAAPLDFRFTIDASRIPLGESASTLQVFRNGSVLPDCAAGASGGADPDPCVAERIALAGGDVQLRVFTSAASQWTFAVDEGCPESLRSDCRPAGSSTLLIKDNIEEAKDALKWKWSKGAATTIAEVSDPRSLAAFRLCLYPKQGTPAGDTALPAGAGWSLDREKRYRYADSAGTAGGVTKLDLVSGPAGRAAVKLSAKGAALPDGLLPDGTTSYAVQLVDEQSDLCWGSSFATVFTKPGQLKAKSE